MLGRCLRGISLATRHLDLVQKMGSAAQFLEALELWEQSIKQAQEAASTCKRLVDDEAEAWLKS